MTGVVRPVDLTGAVDAMPPDGGGSLTTSEERAVAAYVYSLRGNVRCPAPARPPRLGQRRS